MRYAIDGLRKSVVDELGGALKFHVEYDELWGDLVVFPNRVIAKEIVQFYQDEDKHMYKAADEIQTMTQYLQLFPPPISWEHPQTDTLTSLKEPVGFIRDPHYKDGRAITDLVYVRSWLGEDRYQDLIMGKKPDVSIGFFYEDDLTEGEFDGVAYQSAQRGIYVNHIATTSKGRCSLEDGCGLMARYDSALGQGKQFAYDSVALADETLYVAPISGARKISGGQLTPPPVEPKTFERCIGYYQGQGYSETDAITRCEQIFPEMQQDNFMQTLKTCIDYYMSEQGMSAIKAEEACEKVFSMALLGSSYEIRQKAKARWRGDSADVRFKQVWDAVNTYKLPMITKVEMALNMQKVVEGMS
jgi:hypothetical protein